MNLEEKNILITGASSGIGRACAIEFNKSGATVHLIARNIDRLQKVANCLVGSRFSLHYLDVTDSDAIEPVIKDIVTRFGLINGFVHSAGVQRIQAFRNIDKAHYLDVFNINTIAAFDISRVLVKKAYCSDAGLSIVFLSSVMSVVADAGLTSYCASKAALIGGARAMAVELAPRKIRVNCVSPGTVEDTLMTDNLRSSISEDEYTRIVNKYPIGLGTTLDVARVCKMLLSDESSWITGQNIVIDGGYSIV